MSIIKICNNVNKVLIKVLLKHLARKLHEHSNLQYLIMRYNIGRITYRYIDSIIMDYIYYSFEMVWQVAQKT